MVLTNAIWHRKIVEPQKRNKDGVKWIVHRFPIKGGISLRDALVSDMFRPSPFSRYLVGELSCPQKP